MVIDNQEQFFNEVILKIKNVVGVDVIYFLKNNVILNKHHNFPCDTYLEQVQNILKSDPSLGTNLFSDEFHTYSFLNEAGLMVISKLSNVEGLYMIIVAGENEPVDLLNLLKICKETRLSFQGSTVTNA